MDRARQWRFALPLLAVAGLLAFGPEWPARTTELTCRDGGGAGRYSNMDACIAAMDDQCTSCSVRERWFAPFVYFLILPGLLVWALSVASKAVARGTGSVWLVLAVVFIIPFMAMFYPPNLRTPLFLQNAVFVWPQLVFFGPTLYLASPASAPLLSEVGSYLGTIAFWLAAALGFGLLTARLAARWLLLPLAAGFVIMVVLLVRFGAPLVGLRQSLENGGQSSAT
jgi:hypothetical protein